jgi:hypothetical protein
VRDAAATAGAAMDASEVGAGAGSAACAEAVATRDDATTAADAATVRILSLECPPFAKFSS